MSDRNKKIEELLESMGTLRKNMSFKGVDFQQMPKVTPSQWGALMLVEQQSGISVKELAHELHITSSAATQLVDGLVKSGYVEREEYAKDRRTVALTLSQKTKKMVEKMKKSIAKRFSEVFNVLSDKELNQYCSLHKKIVQRFSNKK